MERKLVLILFILHTSFYAFASEGPILSFTQWKNSQVIDAENRTARLENRITMHRRAGQGTPAEMAKAEEELRASIENLEVIRSLQLEEYFHIYLSKFHNNINALQVAAKGLSEAEVAELLRIFLRTKSDKVNLGTKGNPSRTVEAQAGHNALPAI